MPVSEGVYSCAPDYYANLGKQGSVYDAFEHMCASLFLDEEDMVAVLTAYLDESYNQRTIKNPNDPLAYTVGCWLSTVREWKKFNKKWLAVLKGAEIEWFHMSEYESRFKEYKSWPDSKRITVLKKLHGIIKDHTIQGVTVSVNCADYDEVLTNDWKQIFGKTYYSFNVRMIMKFLAEWADEKGQPGPIHYVFAELNGQGNELDKIFRESLKMPNVRKWLRLNGMWSKGLMREVTQLQAADIVAYELNKRVVNHMSPNENFVRKSLNNLAEGIYMNRLAPLYFGKDELIRLLHETQHGTPR